MVNISAILKSFIENFDIVQGCGYGRSMGATLYIDLVKGLATSIGFWLKTVLERLFPSID